MLFTLFLLNGGGLNGVVDEIISNWIGPVFFLVVAGVALMFIKNRQFRELFAFIGIAIVVGLLVFFTRDMFGKDKGLSRVAKEKIVSKINVVQPIYLK